MTYFCDCMGYDIINNKKELITYCKRKRKKRMVILSDEFVNKNKVMCAYCHKPILDRHNRAWVYPKTNEIVAFHYDCVWTTLFSKLYSKRVLTGLLR